jgi:two-component system, OmpR family, sensor histidine kinase KdpD
MKAQLTPHWLRDYAGTLAIVTAALAIGFVLQRLGVHPANFSLVFLTAVLVSAIVYGLWQALLACLFSLLTYNFFFLPPLYTFTIADRSNIVTLFFFGVVAVLGSNLAARVRRQNVVAETERLRSAMLTSLSHDLRTPLASILGAASSLRGHRESLDGPAQDDLIATVQEEAERLHRFIGNLLDMTRLECGAIVPKLEAVDLSDVTGTALRRAEDILRDHRVEVDIPQDLPLVQLDPVLFEQVLFNLLDNAAKYAPQHTRVLLRAREDGSAVKMEIADEGGGVPLGERERIFDRFHRAKSADHKRAGTGLGLAICRGFLHAMKSSIVVGNRDEERGAVFTITVPVPPHPARPAS